VVRGLKDRERPLSNLGLIATVGSGEIWDHWIGGQANLSRPIKRKKGLRSQPSDPIGKRDQWTTDIVVNQVARDIISQGGIAIKTMVSPRGYVSV
jgi:hypothetical protein